MGQNRCFTDVWKLAEGNLANMLTVCLEEMSQHTETLAVLSLWFGFNKDIISNKRVAQEKGLIIWCAKCGILRWWEWQGLNVADELNAMF